VSFHDNFDDAYRDSPAWDETVIARDERGELRARGVAGGQSYILAPAKYARKAGLERVRRTVERLAVRDTYHIDVLSAVPMRRDHDAASRRAPPPPAGKLAIIASSTAGID